MQNFNLHVIALSMNKLADGLLNPKLVLAWLLTTLGAGSVWVGLLVPVREAGALLPQLFIAEPVRRMTIRKWAWVVGGILQGLAALGIAAAAIWLQGAMAGMVIVGFVAVLAVARSLSSVSYKDVLGKTVVKTVRGRVSGTAASIAAVGVFLFGSLLLFGVIERFILVVAALAVAGALWIVAGMVFALLQEEPSTPVVEQGENVWRRYIAYLKNDTELQRLIIARSLLLATAIAPPYLLLLSDQVAGGTVGQIGMLVLASSLATMVSGRVWGVMSDRSTPAVLVYSGVIAGVVLVGAVVAAQAGYFTNSLVLPGLLFVLLVAYQGVRIARTTHLVNIANENTRAGYTAISNTIVGVALLMTGALGALVPFLGISAVVGILAVMSFAGAVVARQLTP